jgi:hypothetical protein
VRGEDEHALPGFDHEGTISTEGRSIRLRGWTRRDWRS